MEEKELKNCSKCGMCLFVCPVYNVLLQEPSSPRAKLQLIKFYEKETLESSPELSDIVSKCLMCGSCTTVCPSGIDHYARFMEMRSRMAGDHGDKMVIRSMVYLLAKEYRLKLAAGMARLGRKLMPQSFQEKYNLGSIAVKRLPEFNEKPFRESTDPVILPENPEEGIKGTVLYFTGCATNYLFDRTGTGTVNILTAMGFKVIIPEEQTCCGIPMLFHGAVDRAKSNIARNIRAFDPRAMESENIKAVIVDCPTCGAALKNEYPALKESLEPELHDAAKRISPKVMDIMSFMVREFGTGNLPEAVKNLKDRLKKGGGRQAGSRPFDFRLSRTTVTYHQPCHLRNSLGPQNNTEKILQILPDIEYVRASDMDQCCGGGGTFFYEYPEVSKQIVDKKIENARHTGADIWVTDCPVCRINLAGSLEVSDDITLKHPVEMIGL